MVARLVMLRVKCLLVLLAALALGACGVKGPLEPPPGAPQPTAAAAAVPPGLGEGATVHTPGVSDIPTTATARHGLWDRQERKRSNDPLQDIPRPDQPFILDGLL